ncbi:MAG: CPBP family intramembrane metalloprotease [Caldilineaceae bacterium]|nr:CPBP family intramembrane metalloprotease [Caldilineaceae bacterium]
MFTQIGSVTKAALYYVVAFALAVVVAMFGERLGDVSRIVSMFTPLAAVLIMLLLVTRDGYRGDGWQNLGVHRLGLSGWPLAILGPVVVLGCTYGFVWLTGIGRIDWSNFGGMPDLLSSLFIGTLYAMAEEVGWRGYLLPMLLPLGRTRALLLSGFLHGVYHLPLMLMTPYYHGSGNRTIVIFLFLATMTAAGVIYGYLRLTTESTWPAAVAHNVFNTVWYTFASITVAAASPVLLEYLAGESGVLTLIGVVVVAIWLIDRLNRQEQPAAVKRLAPAGS